MTDYRDRWTTVDDDGVQIKAYYFPWGSKRLRYDAITDVARSRIGVFTGRGRIWGATDPRYWFGLDPGRPRKEEAFVLGVAGSWVHPVVTPDDPDAFAAALVRHGVRVA